MVVCANVLFVLFVHDKTISRLSVRERELLECTGAVVTQKRKECMGGLLFSTYNQFPRWIVNIHRRTLTVVVLSTVALIRALIISRLFFVLSFCYLRL